jgi:hypothetical protein
MAHNTIYVPSHLSDYLQAVYTTRGRSEREKERRGNLGEKGHIILRQQHQRGLCHLYLQVEVNGAARGGTDTVRRYKMG